MMSEREFSRLKVMTDLIDGRLCIEAAGALISVGRWQVFRLRRAFEARGPAGLVSDKRGKPSNRTHGATLRQTADALAQYPHRGSDRMMDPSSPRNPI